MSKFLKDIVTKTKNDMASVASDGIPGADVAGFVDTGSYLFNAMVSGSIYGGLAVNKITAIAGPEATGKTFFALSVVQNFLKTNPDGVVLYYDTEQAITTSMLDERNIPKDRIAILPVVTVEEFRFQLLQVLNDYKENKETTPMLCVCDSLGMLSTKKEIEDTAEGKDTKDMTRASLIKATFRVLTLKLGQLGIPLLLTNHTYEGMGMFSTTTMSGGCLVPGTKVMMEDHTLKNIEDIKEGDYLCPNVLGDVMERNIVENTFVIEENKPTIEIELETGQKIECSYDHKFVVKLDSDRFVWKKAINLTEEDDIWTKEEFQKTFTDGYAYWVEEKDGQDIRLMSKEEFDNVNFDVTEIQEV